MKEKRSSGMVKSLSKWNLLSIGIGAVIGWSWVIYAGYWSVTPGTLGGILAFVVAALLCSLVGLVYAELTSAFPKIGVDVSITFLGLGQIPSIIVSWNSGAGVRGNVFGAGHAGDAVQCSGSRSF